MKFTEEKLEQAIIELFGAEGISHQHGSSIHKEMSEVLLKDDLKHYLLNQYNNEGITLSEIDSIIRKLEVLPSSALYDSNKAFMKMIADGFSLKREDASQKDIHIHLIDYSKKDKNIYKVANQLEIHGYETRIPDLIVYINGLPLVVWEIKSATREEATLEDAFKQLTIRYKRDIPELFKYNAFCVISDGANNKAGSFFAPYEFFYTWRKIDGSEIELESGKNKVLGIDSLHTLVKGMFHKDRLRNIIHNFIFFPDSTQKEMKIVCRYPQFYAATKLLQNIKIHHRRPEGELQGKALELADGKGGTYFGATGSGKSYTMLYLTRLLMKDPYFSSPTIILITDRTDLDDQLSGQFTNAKRFIGDDTIESVESRTQLKEKLLGRQSGGVFLTTIHKFTEETDLLTVRNNVICISDEAHRSQVNLDQKVVATKDGVKKTYGFAKHLHDSLPNATYVGFTGTPIDATLNVFGDVIDAYTMTESVKDEITVRIVYEGRAAKVILKAEELKKIEEYYTSCAAEGSTEYQIDKSKRESAHMEAIIGDPDRLKAVAKDFVEHYEKRIEEGATLKGKAMFVCYNRTIAYEIYKEIIKLRPQWAEVGIPEKESLSEKEVKEILPMEYVKMIMTRNKDDHADLYKMLGTKEYRKELDRQFKNPKSNFKIAIVVDMWLTGFDVPFLDTMYIDKPIQQHTLIQTISRVNRKFENKSKGLVVDYIGIKKEMNKALKKYSKTEKNNIEDIKKSVTVVKDHLDLLHRMFSKFNDQLYFEGTALQQLDTLNFAVEFVQSTHSKENKFKEYVKRLKSAYDIACASEEFTQKERDYVHFYMAIRTILNKMSGGDAPDTTVMNARVREMIEEAIKSEGVEEVFKIGDDTESEIDIFDDDYLAKVSKIKMPNTKIKLLQKLLAKAIAEFHKCNRMGGINFSKKMNTLVEKYNDRKAQDVLVSEVMEDFADEIVDLYYDLKSEMESFEEMGITFEEKAFYDILKEIAIKYEFEYPHEKLLHLSQEVKKVVDDKSKYTDWSHREDIKAELKVDLIILLAENGYPPVTRDEVFKEIFEQAENFKKYRA
jgi:type I restriction enzyme R subunit